MPTTTMAELEVLARVMEITIPPEYKDGVLVQFQRLEVIAATINAQPIPPEIEPATVFCNDRP